MKILLDHNVPRKLGRMLPGFEVLTTYRMGWAEIRNGELLRTAVREGVGALLTIDKKMEYEQNLRTLPLPIILIDAVSNRLPDLTPFVPVILEVISRPLSRALYVLKMDGAVEIVSNPRQA